MKTRTHSHDYLRRPAGTSISHQGSFLAALAVGLHRAVDAVTEIVGTKSRRRSHLRLVRRNGRPVPVPLRTVVKTWTPRTGRIIAGVLLTLSLVAAGIGGGIYLRMHATAVSRNAAK